MKKSKKGLIIGIAIIAVLAIAAVVAIIFSSKRANQSGYTVKFELCTELQTTTVLDRTVAPGSFLEEPEVYVTESNEENWGIVGWYREPEYETQWDFDFDTVDSNLTLYAKWATNPQCTVSFYTAESTEAVITTTVRKGLVVTPCDEEFVGREVLGYYCDKAMTEEWDFKTKIEEDTDIYVDISKYVYFNAKTISKWNLCGNQTEVDNYEVSASLSGDEEILTVTSKNGGYIWLKSLNLAMNDTSIIEIKMREVNDNYSGAVGGYILGSYMINGEAGASSDFGQPNTGRLRYARSAKPDEDGFYTYTYNISNLTPGLVYTEMNGLRLDFSGADKYVYEIKEIKTFVDEYAVSGEAFVAKGINFTGLHLNTFTLMGEAETKMLENGNLRFGGPNGAYIYKKGLNITLGDEQIIRLKAKGDLKGGAIALFFFGEYTQDGKKGVTTDFTAPQRVTFVAGETDAKGYTTYTADLSTIPGLKVNVLNGLRIDLYGEGTRTIEMQSLKSYAPTKEETEIAKGFTSDGLNLNGSHFTTFLKMGEAEGSLLDSGDYKFGGPNGAYLHRKNVEITLDDDQKIELKAKGDLKGGRIRLYLFGKYTQDGKAGTTTDYNVDHKWDFVAEETDAAGYTTYSLNLDSIKGLKFNTIHGLRLDLYGEGTRAIEIASLKSVVPSKEETEVNNSFTGKGLDFTGAHLAKFNVAGSAETTLLDNGDYKFGGPNGAMIHYKGMEITLEDDQIIELKAKGELKGGAIALFFYGDYTKNGTAGTLEDYDAKHRVTFVAGKTDEEGYTTYTADISSAIAGMHYDVLRGLRIDLYGEGTRTIEIKLLKSVAPSKEDMDINAAFTATGLNLTGAHFTKFLQVSNAETELLANGDLKLSGDNGSFIHKKQLEITLGEDQTIQLKAKTALKGGRVDIYLFGDYTQDGVAAATTDYGKHRWKLSSGETDAEGYTTYTFNIGDIAGLTYQTIRGIRVDLIGSTGLAIEIQSLKSMVPSDLTVNYYVGSTSIYNQTVKAGEKISKPADSLIAMGHKILGYYSDAACETAYDFGSSVKEDTSIYVKLSEYMYFSPAMLKEFKVASGTAGSATATTEVVEGVLKMDAVHGSFIYKKDMNLDVSNTQVIEFTASATVDVSLIDIWLFGTYTKDGQQYTNTAEDVNLRWRITPDTTGEYVTYKLDLSESPKASGMVWEKITGIRIDMHLHNINNTGIINIQSIEAVEASEVAVKYIVSGETVHAAKVTSGEKATQPTEEELAIFGHEIIGFYTDAECTTVFDFDTAVREDTDVYVKLSDYMYLSGPMMNEKFEAKLGGTKSFADGAVHLTGVNGAALMYKALDIDVTDTQKLEIKMKATDVQRVDIWLFGTYSQNGEEKTITSEVMRWFLYPTSEYGTYTLDLANADNPTGTYTGLEWTKITGMRIGVVQNDATKTPHLDIEYMKTIATKPVSVNYYVDGAKVYTANVMAGSKATVPTLSDLKLTEDYQVAGYYTDASFTQAFDHNTVIIAETNVYVKTQYQYMYLDATIMNEKFEAKLGGTKSFADGAVHLTGVNGAALVCKTLDVDVTDTQKLEIKLKVTDVQRVDIWLFGTYSQNGEEKTVTSEVMRWFLYPTSEYGTYTLDLANADNPTGTYTGLEWTKITGMRIGVVQNDAAKTPHMDIQYIKALPTSEE